MKSLKRIVVVLALLASMAGGAGLAAQTSPPPKSADTEFVPIDQLPPQEQLPAAPLLIGAYAFVALAL